MSKLIIDITQEEIEYAQDMKLTNIVALSMFDPNVVDIKATEAYISFYTNGEFIKVKTPTKLRVFLYRYARKTPVHPIRVEVKY